MFRLFVAPLMAAALLGFALLGAEARANPTPEAARLVSSVLAQRKAETWALTSEGFVAGESRVPAPIPLAGLGAVHVDRARGLLYGLERGERDVIWEANPRTGHWRVVADQDDRTIRGIAADPSMDGLLTGFSTANGQLGLLRINPRTGMTMELRFPPSVFEGLESAGPNTRLHVLGAGSAGVVVLLEGASDVPALYVLDVGKRTAEYIGPVRPGAKE